MTNLTTLAALLAVGLLTSCAPQQSVATPPFPPVPPLTPETKPLPPAVSEPVMWQPGHWDWNGNGYDWAKGQYVPAAGHGNWWTPGWWSLNPDRAGWTWMPPHWSFDAGPGSVQGARP